MNTDVDIVHRYISCLDPRYMSISLLLPVSILTHSCVTVLCCGVFIPFQEGEQDPLLQGLYKLKDTLNSTSDLLNLDVTVFLRPFCEIVQSDDTTGPITGMAIASLDKFLAYGLIGQRRGREEEGKERKGGGGGRKEGREERKEREGEKEGERESGREKIGGEEGMNGGMEEREFG